MELSLEGRLPKDFEAIEGFIFDIDGTLTDEQSRTSERTIEALRLLHDAGFAIILATGRILNGGTNLLLRAGIRGWVVAATGGVIWDGDRVVDEHFMDPELLSVIGSQARQRDLSLAYYTAEGLHIEGPFNEELVYNANEGRAVESLEHLDRSKVVKVSLHGSVIALDEAEHELKMQFPQMVRSHGEFLDISRTDINKWTGIRRALDTLRISPERMCGVGDSGNDISWMEQVALPIAASGSTADVIAVARWRLPREAESIYRFACAVLRDRSRN